MSSKTYLRYVFLKCLQDVSKTSSRRLPRRVCKTLCNFVFKTSSRRLGRQKNVTLKTSSRRLEYVFTKTNLCWDECLLPFLSPSQHLICSFYCTCPWRCNMNGPYCFWIIHNQKMKSL